MAGQQWLIEKVTWLLHKVESMLPHSLDDTSAHKLPGGIDHNSIPVAQTDIKKLVFLSVDDFKTLLALASGDVVGPASSVDDRVVTFDGITGKLIQDSGVAIADVSSAISASHTQNTDEKIVKGDTELSIVDSGSGYINIKIDNVDKYRIVPDGITNSDGDFVLQLADAGSNSVNLIGVRNAITNNPPELSATGSDSNVSLKVNVKGTGSVKIYDTAGTNLIAEISSSGIDCQSGNFLSAGVPGVTGSFIDNDGNTVSVEKGIITSLS